MRKDIQTLIDSSKDKGYSKLTDKKLWRYETDEFKNSIKQGGKTQGKINAENGHAKKQYQLIAGIGGKVKEANC